MLVIVLWLMVPKQGSSDGTRAEGIEDGYCEGRGPDGFPGRGISEGRILLAGSPP